MLFSFKLVPESFRKRATMNRSQWCEDAYLDDLLSVLGGVHRRLGEEDLAVARVDVELLGAKGVVPQVLHVIPVAHNAVLHGVVDLQHGAQLTRFVPHHQVL